MKLKLLDSILRAGHPDSAQSEQESQGLGNKHDPARCLEELLQGELPKGSKLDDGSVIGVPEIAPEWSTSEMEVRMVDTWVPEPCKRSPAPGDTTDKHCQEKPSFNILLEEKGPDRQPPNHYDLRIFSCEPNWIKYEPNQAVTPHTCRQDVPFVNGAFVLSGVLTPGECQQLIHTAECMGFGPDHPTAKAAPTGIDTCEWLADDSVLGPIFDRVKTHLPQQLAGGKAVAGINARWRMFRYGEGAVYRPHIDGSWPGSGLNSAGKYVHDPLMYISNNPTQANACLTPK